MNARSHRSIEDENALLQDFEERLGHRFAEKSVLCKEKDRAEEVRMLGGAV
jgi:hypothetical protein